MEEEVHTDDKGMLIQEPVYLRASRSHLDIHVSVVFTGIMNNIEDIPSKGSSMFNEILKNKFDRI